MLLDVSGASITVSCSRLWLPPGNPAIGALADLVLWLVHAEAAVATVLPDYSATILNYSIFYLFRE